MTHAESKPDESHWYVHAQLLRITNKIYCNANPDPDPAVMIDTFRIKGFLMPWYVHAQLVGVQLPDSVTGAGYHDFKHFVG